MPSINNKVGLLLSLALCWLVFVSYGRVLIRQDAFVPERIKEGERDDILSVHQHIPHDPFRPITRLSNSHNEFDERLEDPRSNLRRNLQNARIIGGGEAKKNRYPYIASLTYERAHTCGGSLIADDIILSAAHCYKSFDGVDLGRHNVKDKEENFERYNIEKFITHPDYVDQGQPGAAFDNDFMIIKLYGWSEQKTIKLNRDPDIPKLREELTVMGWGVADNANKLPSEILKDVTVNALTNTQCKNRSGYLGMQAVSFMNKITDNMMCAEDADEDACQGDSGGPLIVKSLIPRLDVQVGVVSWGLGCAHNVFPGIYSRISSQSSWIRDQVCALAESPPEHFDCDKKEDRDDDDKSGKVPVTVDIMLDRFPKETGWLIRSDAGKSIAYIAVGAYKGLEEDEKHIFSTVHLTPNQHYDFIMLDSYGDGLKFDGGEYKLWLGDTAYMGKLLHKGSTFERAKHHRFYVPAKVPPIINNPGQQEVKPPQPSPNNETPAPTKFLPFVTIAIKHDDYPEEIGWSILSDDNIIEKKMPGAYKEKNKLVIEKVRIPIEYDASSIKFAIVDDGNDGLCCNKGQGLFQVFVGDIADGNMVAKGSMFKTPQACIFNMHEPFHFSGSGGTDSKACLNPNPDSPTTTKGITILTR